MHHGSDRLTSLAIGIAVVGLSLLVRWLRRRMTKPERETYRCAGCRREVRHDARSLKAWCSGARKLYCTECHAKWKCRKDAEWLAHKMEYEGKSLMKLTKGLWLVAVSLLSTAQAETVWLENARLKVGVNDAGVLVHFENKRDDDASVGNMITTGVQPCFREYNGGKELLPSGFDATRELSADGRTLVCRCTMADVRSGTRQPSLLTMTYVLHTRYLEVTATFTDKAGIDFQAGAHHEVPAFYALKGLSTFTCYLGASAWSGGALTVKNSPPFWGGNSNAYLTPKSSETWGTWTSPTTGKGIGLYREGADCLLIGQDASSSYLAPLAICALQKNGTTHFTYYLAAGTVPQMRAVFADIHSGCGDRGFAISLGSKPSAVVQYERAGFPPSYATRLAALHAQHPAWQFDPLPISDIAWSGVVDAQMYPSRNLIAYSTWAPSPWGSLGYANYTPYIDPSWKAYDSGAFYQVSRAGVEYFLDPRNFLNATDIFMFVDTFRFNASADTQAAVESALAGSFMANACHDDTSEKFSALLVRLGAEYGVSAVFLASRLKGEQGNGTVQAFGTIGDSLLEIAADEDGKVGSSNVWGTNYTKDNAATRNAIEKGAAYYNGYYNFFNMGAAGTGLFEIRYNAWKEAYEAPAKYAGPWTTQEKAIRGGTIKMREKYVDSCRYTSYLQKFNVSPESPNRWVPYMQNIGAPIDEARSTRKAYETAGALESAYRFVIPVYVSMPENPCPDPANGQSRYSPTK